MKSFPFYKQYDAKQCGITCLRMICKYYGKSLSIEHIAQYCHTSNEGASLLGISEGLQDSDCRLMLQKFPWNNYWRLQCHAYFIGIKVILSFFTE